MPEQLIRKIPEVDVKLDEFDFTKEFPSFNSKDFMTKIFGVKNLVTTNPDEYKTSISDLATNAAVKSTSKQPTKYLLRGDLEAGGYKIIKDVRGQLDVPGGATAGSVLVEPSLLPPLILLGSAMILRPYAWQTNTTISTDNVIITGKGKRTRKGSGHTPITPFLNTWEYDNMSFTVPSDKKFDERNTGISSNTEIVRKPQTFTLGRIDPDDFTPEIARARSKKLKGEALTDEESTKLKAFEDKVYSTITPDLRLTMESVFKLSKNQPFFIRTRMHKMTEGQINYANTQVFSRNKWAQFYPNTSSKYTALELTWGGGAVENCRDQFKLVIRSDAQTTVSLYRKTPKEGWKLHGSPRSLPSPVNAESSEDGYVQFTVYPLGRNLLIASGIPSTESTVQKKFIRFSFNRFVNIEPSTLEVSFYGGETYFSCLPIVHVAEGELLSPPASCAFNVTHDNAREPGRYYLKVDYEGKFRQDHFGTPSIIDEIQLPLPTEEDQGDTCDGGGETINRNKGQKKAKRTKKKAFFEYVKPFVSLSKQIHRKDFTEGQTDEAIKAYYSSSKNKRAVADNQFKYAVKLKARPPEGFSKSTTADMVEGEKSDGDEEIQANKRIYSPAVYKVELHIDPPIIEIPMRPSPQIDNADVKGVSVSQNVQELSATVEIVNRPICDDRFGGLYNKSLKGNTGRTPNNNFVGVKPITIKGGITFDPFVQSREGVHNSGGEGFGLRPVNQPYQFKGYVVNRSFNRPSPAEAYVTLECADVSKRAREQMAVNLPIFDGMSHMAAMYWLCKEVGYLDTQLMFYQDNRNPADNITLKEMIEAGGGDVITRQGGGFAGHVPRFPRTIGPASRVCNLPPSTIFALLPLNAFREQPAYMFQMGTYIWDCMMEIREFSGWYLYPNHFGNIVYGPPEAVLGIRNTRSRAGGSPSTQVVLTDVPDEDDSDGAGTKDKVSGGSIDPISNPEAFQSGGEASTNSDFVFREVSGGSNSRSGSNVDPLKYDQYQRQLQVTYGTDHVRNAVMAQSMIQASEDPTNPVKYTPVTVVEKQKGWPYNIGDFSYIPWPKWLIARSPYWNDLARLQRNTKQRLQRAIMPRLTPNFGAWGKARLYPYDIVLLEEGQADETGIDGVEFVVQNVDKSFAPAGNFDMSVSTEYVNFNIFEWSPHENQGVAMNQGAG
jgi:hypothetical protein